MPLRDIIIVTLVVVSLPFCFFRPYYGVLTWAVLSLLNPHALSWGMARQIPMAMAVALATMAGALIFGRVWSGLRSREVLLIVMLWIWFTLTALNASHTPELMHYQEDTWHRWEFVSKILLMTLVSIGIVNSWPRLRYLVLAMAGTFGFFIVKAIPWAILAAGGERLYGPEGTMLADNNDFGLALNMTAPMFLCLAQTETNPRMRWLMWFLFAVSIPAVFLTYSRGALVGLVVVLVLIIMRLRQRIPVIAVLVLACLLAVSFAPEKWKKRMDFRRDNAVLDTSALSRINAWTYSWRFATDYPIMGGGFEAFTPTLFERYAPDPLDVHGPHSIYFGVLAEQGFVGLFLYLSLIASCLLSLQKIRKYGRHSGNERAAGYAMMLQLSLAGFLASGAFLGRAYFDYFFTIVACTAMLKQVCASEARELAWAPEMVEQEQMA